MDQGKPVFDVEHLGAAMGGDTALMKHFILRFLDNARHYVEEMQSRVDSSNNLDAKAWSGDVHRLKGAARTVGAMRLAAICEEVESIEVDHSVFVDAVQSIGEEYDAVSIAVRRWLEGC